MGPEQQPTKEELGKSLADIMSKAEEIKKKMEENKAKIEAQKSTEALKNLTNKEKAENIASDTKNILKKHKEKFTRYKKEEEKKLNTEEESISKKETVNQETKEKLWDKETAEKINSEETPKNPTETETPLTDQEKERVMEDFLKSKEEELNKKIEYSKVPSKIWEKTKEWLNKKETKEVGKAGAKAMILAGVTIGIGAIVGITPTNFGSIAYKIGRSGIAATGINIATSSNLAKKFAKKPDENKSWIKREMNLGNLATVAGIGASAILTGGIAAPLIGIGSYAFRRGINWVSDKKIKELEKENTEESLAKIKTIKFWKDIAGGTLIIGSGLATMATLAHDHEIETQSKNNPNTETKPDTTNTSRGGAEDVQNTNENTITDGEKAQIEKDKILEHFKNQETTIHKGEGVEHSFIRQIEGNKELAEKLKLESNFEGDLNDPKILHSFAQHQAHVIAMNEGYVNSTGQEVIITEADKVSYEIKTGANGEITVEEKSINGGDPNKYEKIHIKDSQDTATKEMSQQDHIEAEAEENRIILNEKKIDPMRIDSDDIEIKDGHPKDHIIEYDDTSKPTGSINEEELNINKDSTQQLNEVSLLKNISGKEYNAIDWAKSPENLYKISLSQLNEVNTLHKINLNSLIENKSLNLLEKDELSSIIKQERADAFMGLKSEDISPQYRSLGTYINKLHKITGLEPKSGTMLTPAETNENYMYRALMKVAELKKLGELKLSK